MAGKPFIVEPMAFTIVGTNSETTGAPAAHLGEFHDPGMMWRTGSITGGSAAVVVDLGALRTFDFIGLLQTNAQAGTQIQAQADNGNTTLLGGSPTFTTGTQTLITPAVTGRSAYHWHQELSSPQTRRYVAIIVSNHTGAFDASMLVIGSRITSTRYYEPEWEAGPLDLSELGEGRNGVADMAAGAMWRELSFTLGWMSESEWENVIYPMRCRVGALNPVLICLDPEATTYRQGRTYFGRLGKSRGAKKAFNRFEMQFDIRSFF